MANPLFNAVKNPNFQNQTFQQTNQSMQIKQAYNTFRNSKNPMQLFNNMAMKSPQMQPIVQMLNGGANPQQLFYNLCQQRGINPQEFLDSFTK